MCFSAELLPSLLHYCWKAAACVIPSSSPGPSESLSGSDIEKHDCRVPGVISRSPRLVSSFEDVQPFVDRGHQHAPRTTVALDQPLRRARRASDVQLWGRSHYFRSLKRTSALIIHVGNALIWSGGIKPLWWGFGCLGWTLRLQRDSWCQSFRSICCLHMV